MVFAILIDLSNDTNVYLHRITINTFSYKLKYGYLTSIYRHIAVCQLNEDPSLHNITCSR